MKKTVLLPRHLADIFRLQLVHYSLSTESTDLALRRRSLIPSNAFFVCSVCINAAKQLGTQIKQRTDTSAVILDGWLKKRGGFVKNWKTRWFTLESSPVRRVLKVSLTM